MLTTMEKEGHPNAASSLQDDLLRQFIQEHTILTKRVVGPVITIDIVSDNVRSHCSANQAVVKQQERRALASSTTSTASSSSESRWDASSCVASKKPPMAPLSSPNLFQKPSSRRKKHQQQQQRLRGISPRIGKQERSNATSSSLTTSSSTTTTQKYHQLSALPPSQPVRCSSTFSIRQLPPAAATT